MRADPDPRGITWQWVSWEQLSRDALHDLARLRQDVFVVEQACIFPDLDGRDPEAHHLLGYCDRVLAAYLRAFHSHRSIGRVVVSPNHRRCGLGRILMGEAHRQVEATWGAGAIEVGAQARLEGFYASLGYRVCGPAYIEDGIPHLPMRRP